MNSSKILKNCVINGLLSIQLCLSLAVKAQVVTLSSPTTGDTSSNQSITLLPGFYTAGPFRAYIVGTLNVQLGSLPSQDRNYIREKTYKVASTKEIVNPMVNQQSEVIKYFDGLGRVVQNIQTKGSPVGNDIVQPTVYDEFDREAVKYLPYAEQSGNGTFKATAISTQAQFYGSSGWDATVVKTTAPYGQSVFDSSPLNRIIEQGAPGTVWQPAATRDITSGRTLLFTYGTNDASTTNYNTTGYGVRLWFAKLKDWSRYTTTLSSSENYAAGELFLKITKDENWTTEDGKAGTMEEYTDRAGHIILKRTFDENLSVLSTYYLYDDVGNLCFVIPPGAEPDAGVPQQDKLDQFCYQYRYDGKNRLVEKKLPGAGWYYQVYNNRNQPVLSQDSVQRAAGMWAFTKYDALGRTIMTGIYASSSTRADLESTLNAETIYFESPQSTGVGYTSLAFPQTVSSYFNILYYDDYSFPGGSTYAYTSAGSTRGLLTGSNTYILGTSNALSGINYYDDEGRVAKVFKQHYQGGKVNIGNYDEISNTYNFEGFLTGYSRIHHNVNGEITSIFNRYEYDHVGRKLRNYEKINNDIEVLLSENTYNEIGQLKTKALNNGMQRSAYTYNERGWLKTNTSPEFSTELKYQDGTTPQYNGNISNQLWGAAGSNTNKFTYSYDKLNRLLSGTRSGMVMSEVLSYDVMGNIKTLSRDGVTAGVYSYSGNKLSNITGGGLAASTYEYDGNGNTTKDGRTGVVLTYNELNLPATATKTGLNLSYIYSSSGDKLRKISNVTSRDYIDGIEYNGAAIEIIHTEEGVARKNGSGYSYEYNLTDHLGNVRYSFNVNPVTGSLQRIQSDDYYPFGKRKSSGSPVSVNNKYLYNGKELQDELNSTNEDGQYDYGARFYDPVIARWNVVDPLAEKSRRFSPYTYGVDNPISNIDRDGMETESVHVDKFGTVLKNINDGDNHVYEHDNAKTTADVDKTYSATNTGAGGKDIGELGKTIDVSTIATNLLARDGKVAEGLNTAQWINKVLPGHDWDLKSNTSTVFGVAWKFDQDIKKASGGDNDTFFSFKGMGENGKFTAADFGNYHAGYTGVAAGVSQRTQYTFAGFGEMAKFRSVGDMLHRANEILFNVSPNGDQRPDFHYNTDGMTDASKAGLHP